LMRERGVTADEATSYVEQRWPQLGLWNESFTKMLAIPSVAGQPSSAPGPGSS